MLYLPSLYFENKLTLKSTGSKAYSLGIWTLSLFFWWKLYDSPTVTEIISNPLSFSPFPIWVPVKLWTVEDDWLASNKSTPFIFGFPKYPIVTAPPVFWRPFINPLVALKEKESVKINILYLLVF